MAVGLCIYLSKAQTYEYCTVSLEVILLLRSFSITVVFGFPLAPWLILSVVFCPEQCPGCALSYRVGLKPKQICFDYFCELCATIALAHLTGSSPLLVFPFLLW